MSLISRLHKNSYTPRSKGPTDLQAHRFHMTMARVLLSHTDALVGYKYCNGVDNNHPEDVCGLQSAVNRP